MTHPTVFMVEGLDGSGKTTAIKGAKAFLEGEGYRVAVIGSPNKDNIVGSVIRRDHLGAPDPLQRYSPLHTLFVLDFVETANKLNDTKDQYDFIILDRWWWSTVVFNTPAHYDHYVQTRNTLATLLKAYPSQCSDDSVFMNQLIDPMVVFFDVAPEVGRARTAARNVSASDGIDAADISFHNQIRAKYKEILRYLGRTTATVDTTDLTPAQATALLVSHIFRKKEVFG